MEIVRINSYSDPRLSTKVLAQHGCFTVGEHPFEVEIISQNAAVVRGHPVEYYSQVIEEFRFYAPHICLFYSENGTKLREYPKKQLFALSLSQIQPSQFYVDEDKVAAVKTFVYQAEDIVIPVLPHKGRYISLDGHTRLFCGLQRGFGQVLAFADESGDYIFHFAAEAVKGISPRPMGLSS